MALPNYFHAVPSAGSGNGTVKVSADVHTGRQNRTGTATITPTGGASAKTVSIVQTAAQEFVKFDNVSITIGKYGGNVAITGKSNSKKLSFALGSGGEISIAIPSTYIAAGATAVPGADIAGDPGASSEYAFSVTFVGIPENVSSGNLESILTATADNGASSAITIQQTGVTATLQVTPSSITIPADGTAQTIQITSNTNWTVS